MATMLLMTTTLFANTTEEQLSLKISDLETSLVEEKGVSIKCSQWVEKLNCISYLERAQKLFTFKASRYNLKEIILDELEESKIKMNKSVRISVFQNLNKQMRKLVPSIHKIDELKTLSKSYSKNYSFKVFCGASLNPRECELGLFNFLKSRPKNESNNDIKSVIITQSDKDLSDDGALYIGHNNKNPGKYLSSQIENRTPANL